MIIAGDCDNEGELIQVEILEHFAWRGKTMRALFNTDDPTSVNKAMAGLVPASQTHLRAEAAAARRDADWLIGMNLSPMASTSLVPPSVQFTFPIGRVKSAVQRIVYDRDMEIENFKPEDYFTVSMTVKTDAGPVTLTYAPEEKITDRAVADAIAAAAKEFNGPLTVKTERKRRKPPKMFARSDLEMAAGRELKLSLDDVEKALQPLYEQHYVSYPRTNGRYLTESMIDDVPALLGQMKRISEFAQHVPAKPTIRKGKDGTFSDAGLAKASHEAIGPNVNTVPHNLERLNSTELRLYKLISRRYLEQFLPDYEYDATTISADVRKADAAKPLLFKATGSVPVVWGWKCLTKSDAGGYGGPGSGSPEELSDEDTKEAEEAGQLPKIGNGSVARATGAEVAAKKTQPPPYLTEPTVIAAMKNAAKYVKHAALAKMLEEAEGIGTEATRKNVIGELYQYELLVKTKDGKVKTTAATRAQVPAVLGVAPEIMDPGISALFEENAARIVRGEITRAQHREMVNQWLRAQCEKLRKVQPLSPAAFGAAIAKKAEAFGKPSDGQIGFADAIAAALKIALPANAKGDRSACSAFIEAHKEAYGKWREANPAPAKAAGNAGGGAKGKPFRRKK